jgi:hypothetical protein
MAQDRDYNMRTSPNTYGPGASYPVAAETLKPLEPWIQRCTSSVRINNEQLATQINRLEQHLDRLMGGHPTVNEAYDKQPPSPPVVGEVEVLFDAIRTTDYLIDQLRALVNRIEEL